MQAAVPAGVSPDARSMEAAQPAAFLSAQALVLGLAVAVLLVLVGYPLLWLLFGAFGLPQGFGLEHLARAFTRPQNFAALLNTLETGARRRRPQHSVRRAAGLGYGPQRYASGAAWCTPWWRSPTSRHLT